MSGLLLPEKKVLIVIIKHNAGTLRVTVSLFFNQFQGEDYD